LDTVLELAGGKTSNQGVPGVPAVAVGLEVADYVRPPTVFVEKALGVLEHRSGDERERPPAGVPRPRASFGRPRPRAGGWSSTSTA